MEIKKGKNSFYIGNVEKPMAKINYKILEDELYIEEIYINPQLKGQGIAANLVETTINYAHENDIKIVPVCTYAKNFEEGEINNEQY